MSPFLPCKKLVFVCSATGKKAVEAPILRVKEEDDEEATDSDDYDEDGIEWMEEEENEEDSTDYEEELKRRKRRSKKRDVADWYGADIFKSGLAIRPKNPYFVSRTRKPRDNELVRTSLCPRLCILIMGS